MKLPTLFYHLVSGVRCYTTKSLKQKVLEPNIRWFYATDVPVFKPLNPTYKITSRPKKFLPFIKEDSDKLELTYKQSQLDDKLKNTKVTVNEDGLFSVSLQSKIITPTYWKGPGYEVRRGIWFMENNQPLSDLISEQIEELYQKYRPDYFLNEELHDRKHELPSIKLKSEKELFLKQNQANRDIQWTYEEHDDFSDVPKVLHFKGPDRAVLVNEGQLLPAKLIDNLSTSNSVLGIYQLKRGYTMEESFGKEEENAESNSTVDKVKTMSSEETAENNSSIIELPTKFFNDTNLKFQNMMENDFSNNMETENSSDREIDHLIFCIHGIGQTLSTKYLSINFAHDCNSLRHLMKTEFVAKSKTFVPLAYDGAKPDENKAEFKNCKVQVLPIIWRHDVHFGLDYKDKEVDEFGFPRMPLLSSLNIEGVTPLRNLTADVVLDVLLYYEPKYKTDILDSVTKSINEAYGTYLKNHPDFQGKVSIIGHSLGSAIGLDLLCAQRDNDSFPGEYDEKKQLKFPVENFFALGSPNGVFSFIKRDNIGARSTKCENGGKAVYPKMNNFYNIFYASDLVAYRVEPLVHSSMSEVKPKSIEVLPEESIINDKIQDLKATTDNFSNTVVKKIIENTTSYLDDFTKAESKTSFYKKKNTGVPVDPKVQEYVTDVMYKLNKNGRIDYLLPQGLFDIDVINAVVSHIGYFDDANVADFILSELWKKPRTTHNPVEKNPE